MINKIINKSNKLLFFSRGEQEWRVPNPQNSDIYLVSYPKSGNTWMRYLMAYAIWPNLNDIDLVEMASYIPSFGLNNDMEKMLDSNSPCNKLNHRIIKEHTRYNKKAKSHIDRAIYLVRDGRDAIVSYWHFCNQRDQTSVPLSEFIELSAKPEHSYGAWKTHVTGWINAELEEKLLIRYEDLLKNPEIWLKKALEFAGVDAPDEAINQAISRASFDSMKKLEQTKGFNLDQLKTVNFVRQGKQGTWRESFGENDLARFNKFHGGAIQELGYIW